jgi:glucokinase
MRMVDEACAEAGVAPADVRRAGVSSCRSVRAGGGMVELAAPNICGGIAGPARACRTTG